MGARTNERARRYLSRRSCRSTCHPGAGRGLRALRRSTRCRGSMSLFTPDTRFVVYMNAKDPTPSQELHSRGALAPVFADLNQYAATTHFLGQTTILTLTEDRGTAETYCLAHHVTIRGE